MQHNGIYIIKTDLDGLNPQVLNFCASYEEAEFLVTSGICDCGEDEEIIFAEPTRCVFKRINPKC